MRAIVLINGERQNTISVFNRNMQYGDGLFETCVAMDNQILFWPRHFSRLEIGREKLNINKIDMSIWLSDIKKAFELSPKKNCIVKLILSRGDSLRGYGYKDDIEPVRVVIVSEMHQPLFNREFSLEYAKSGYHSNPQLAGIKHCNRLEQILARSNLLSNEAIMLDEKENIISVTQGNIYFIFGNKLLTPKLDRCGVVGSRRSLILELAMSLKMEALESNISINQAQKADEVFISNSVIGVQPVHSIESHKLGKNPLTEKIQKAFLSKAKEISSWTCP
ncbi:aminodeoxychorismate lyase [Candidatus Pseudothioglobus sp. Uisw_086]|uniref:aminodeoxychorismate lyase n=1 Tax=Candidatus Pseudothioglobus sp. Uisw_086 TaxID=3230998 RepID=UPI003A8B7A55